MYITPGHLFYIYCLTTNAERCLLFIAFIDVKTNIKLLCMVPNKIIFFIMVAIEGWYDWLWSVRYGL